MQNFQPLGGEAVVPVVDAVNEEVEEGGHLESQLRVAAHRVEAEDLPLGQERKHSQVELSETAR